MPNEVWKSNVIARIELDLTKYPNVKIVEIIPSKNLHGWFGALNFKPKQARKLIKLGYDDAIKVLANAEK